jgi:transposase-like protein
MPSKRNKHAALKLMRKLLKKYAFVPERMITDKLPSYGAAARELGIENRHERGRWKNNRAENSHQPTRRMLAIETQIVARSVFAKSLCRLQIIRIETLGGSGDTCAA